MPKPKSGKTLVHPTEFLDLSAVAEYALLVEELASIEATYSSVKSRREFLFSRLQSSDFLADIGRVEIDGSSLGVPNVNCFEGVTSHIDAGRLLERGVDPDIITYATVRSTYPRTDIGWKAAGVRPLVEFEAGEAGEDELEEKLAASIKEVKAAKEAKKYIPGWKKNQTKKQEARRRTK